MASLGIQTYRMGIEWARIEPTPGVFDAEAFAHYREEISLALDKGITPW
jgi:beta-glucosidase